MAYTFTINGQSFGQVSGNVTGRYAVRMLVASDEFDVKRFHPPATDGNLKIYCGRTGGEIVAVMKYIGTLSAALTNYYADMAAWQNTTITIIDDKGTSHARCSLNPKSMTRTDLMGIANTTLVMFDATATFTKD